MCSGTQFTPGWMYNDSLKIRSSLKICTSLVHVCSIVARQCLRPTDANILGHIKEGQDGKPKAQRAAQIKSRDGTCVQSGFIVFVQHNIGATMTETLQPATLTRQFCYGGSVHGQTIHCTCHPGPHPGAKAAARAMQERRARG